jgi:hypothetical protein
MNLAGVDVQRLVVGPSAASPVNPSESH